jgi:hypothetical protein
VSYYVKDPWIYLLIFEILFQSLKKLIVLLFSVFVWHSYSHCLAMYVLKVIQRGLMDKILSVDEESIGQFYGREKSFQKCPGSVFSREAHYEEEQMFHP